MACISLPRTLLLVVAVATTASLAVVGGPKPAVAQPTTSGTVLPIYKQALRNDCEAAALSMLLVARGVRLPQLTLQSELPRSGPLDPVYPTSGGLPIWGDPDRGFVGRPDGGGTAGGYGVYESPIRMIARRHGVRLVDLSGGSSLRVINWLRSRGPVMAWVALSDGPYRTWRTAAGKRVTANFGEHTVVLTAMSGSRIRVNDPIDGRRKVWTQSYFQTAWTRMGRRALGI